MFSLQYKRLLIKSYLLFPVIRGFFNSQKNLNTFLNLIYWFINCKNSFDSCLCYASAFSILSLEGYADIFVRAHIVFFSFQHLLQLIYSHFVCHHSDIRIWPPLTRCFLLPKAKHTSSPHNYYYIANTFDCLEVSMLIN